MSIYHTTTSVTLKARDLIAEKTEAFIARGGSINQIPKGQSAYSLKLRPVENRGSGTRIAWEDDRMSMQSVESRAASIRKMEEKKVREKVRKR
jgi:hypothetical protein